MVATFTTLRSTPSLWVYLSLHRPYDLLLHRRLQRGLGLGLWIDVIRLAVYHSAHHTILSWQQHGMARSGLGSPRECNPREAWL